MKNVWKGLTVGAVVGAAIGIVLDALDATGRRATKAASRAKSGARHLADVIEEKINDA